ncbi:MAG: FkbM family methyltransferase [Saprospiraceae bacterium]|nr:FkbM family methyltransferase [Saprospiraceae bacterium]
MLSLPIPTLLKIDTEGAEFDIIKGATKLLEIPSIIFVCELHPFAWGWYKDNSWDEFLALLKSYDRKILVLDPKKTFSDLPYYGTIIF